MKFKHYIYAASLLGLLSISESFAQDASSPDVTGSAKKENVPSNPAASKAKDVGEETTPSGEDAAAEAAASSSPLSYYFQYYADESKNKYCQKGDFWGGTYSIRSGNGKLCGQSELIDAITSIACTDFPGFSTSQCAANLKSSVKTPEKATNYLKSQIISSAPYTSQICEILEGKVSGILTNIPEKYKQPLRQACPSIKG